MTGQVDLHLHTNCSDGVLTPAELLEKVRTAQLDAFSITDHDSLEGFRTVRKLLNESDPELLTGVELSVDGDRGDLHLLAYCFDADDKELNFALESFQQNRNHRGAKMVERLNELGIAVTYESVLEAAGKAAVGRPHIAKAILDSGAINSYEEAFSKLIGNGKPAYIPKENFTPRETIEMVHRAGGVVVLAHPTIDNTYRSLPMLVKLGLDGIELQHPSAKVSDRDRIRSLAEKYELITTGGSDYHGLETRHAPVGSQKVSPEVVEQLKERSLKIRKSR